MGRSGGPERAWSATASSTRITSRQTSSTVARFVRWRDVPLQDTRQRWERGFDAAIYALIDPRDDSVRYVGKTVKSLARRLEEHIANPVNLDMCMWVTELVSSGRRPLIRLLTMCEVSNWERHEVDWIRWFRTRGKLLNVDPGGVMRDEKGRLTLRGRIRAIIAAREHGITKGGHKKLRKQRLNYLRSIERGQGRVLTPAEIAALNYAPPRKKP